MLMLLLSYIAYLSKKLAKWVTTTTNGRQQKPVLRAAAAYGRQLKKDLKRKKFIEVRLERGNKLSLRILYEY